MKYNSTLSCAKLYPYLIHYYYTLIWHKINDNASSVLNEIIKMIIIIMKPICKEVQCLFLFTWLTSETTTNGTSGTVTYSHRKALTVSLFGVPAIWLALHEKCACVLVFGCSACEHMCKRSSDACDRPRCWLRPYLSEIPYRTKLTSAVALCFGCISQSFEMHLQSWNYVYDKATQYIISASILQCALLL